MGMIARFRYAIRDRRTPEQRAKESREAIWGTAIAIVGGVVIYLVGYENLIMVVLVPIGLLWALLTSKVGIGLLVGFGIWVVLTPIANFFWALAADVRWIRARLEHPRRDDRWGE